LVATTAALGFPISSSYLGYDSPAISEHYSEAIANKHLPVEVFPSLEQQWARARNTHSEVAIKLDLAERAELEEFEE
jgi:hypothetical protein